MKKEERLLKAMGQVNEQYIQDAAPGRGRTGAPLWQKVTAVAAALALVVAAGWVGFRLGNQNQPGTVPGTAMAAITFDVNPSVELVVDSSETVLEANALNGDGTEVLGGMELVNTNLETATNALIGAFLTNGYLDELQNAILVSVENREGDSAALKEKLSASISDLLQSDGVEGAVLSQTVTSDEERTALAKQYGLSLGKTALIQTIIAQDSTLTFDAMAQLTITELMLVAENRGLDVSSLSQVGEVSDTGYLGITAALEIACQAAGITTEEALGSEVEMDGKNGSIVYEVEFCCGGTEYEYELDAVTGTILKQKQDVCDHAEHNGSGTVDTSGYLGVEAAKQAALADAGVTAGQTKYLNGWLEYDDGVPECYQVEFAVYDSSTGVETVYEYEIHLTNGSVLDRDSEQSSKHEEHEDGHHAEEHFAETAGASYIGESAALKAAYDHAGVNALDAREVQCELDSEDHRMIYDIEFTVSGTEYEYSIDAATGAVVSCEKNH